MVPKRIGFVGFEGFTASHLVASADTFAATVLDGGYANRISCYEICIVGFTSLPLRSESGITFTPDYTMETVSDLDTIVVPGGRGLRKSPVSEAIVDWILIWANRAQRIAAIGSGIDGLAPTGLLDGREVTTDWRYANDVARRFPNMRVDHRRPLVKDGPFYTCSGLTAAIDLSLAFVEEDYGRHVALATTQELTAQTLRRNRQSESSTPLVFNSQPTDRFAELVPWIMRNLDEDLSVNALARRACMSPSHFNRAFKSVFSSTPADFVETLRLNEAKRRLSIRKRTLDTVAASVGFSDADAFRRAFERRFGAKPRAYLNDTDTSVAAIVSDGK